MKCSFWTINHEKGRWSFQELFTCQSVFCLSLHHISWSQASFLPLSPQSHGCRDISETIPHQLTPCFRERAKKVLPNSVAPCSHMWLLKSGHRCTSILHVLTFREYNTHTWYRLCYCLQSHFDLSVMWVKSKGRWGCTVVDLMSLQRLWVWLGTVPSQKV